MGIILNYQSSLHAESNLWFIIIAALGTLIISLIFLTLPLISYIQPTVKHQDLLKSKGHIQTARRLVVTYSGILQKLKQQITLSQKKYRISIILFLISTSLVSLHFCFFGMC